jgi:hypothetical protein
MVWEGDVAHRYRARRLVEGRMFRTGLSIYLAVMTLAGPWLCCCSAARVAGNPTPAAASVPSDADEDLPPCCRHHQAKRPCQPDRQRPHHDGPECPCSKDISRTAVAPDAESARLLWPDATATPLADELAVLPATLTPAADGLAPVPRERRALPFWTAHDLLRTLHLLRC